jgi:nucleoside-diphosphate-sugar epimerase
MVLVTGATGVLGPTIVEFLRKAGLSVRILGIDPPDQETLLNCSDVRVGDILIILQNR